MSDMYDKQMWAIYDAKYDQMVGIETKDRDGKLKNSRYMITGVVADVGKLMEEVQDLDPKGKFYVVRGTFIPEEKL